MATISENLINILISNTTPEVACKVFLSYLREVNRLKEQFQPYIVLSDNCTTSIR